ncbi:hypothetical protein HDU67_009929, partial [Dinochytrium kinnereticum]
GPFDRGFPQIYNDLAPPDFFEQMIQGSMIERVNPRFPFYTMFCERYNKPLVLSEGAAALHVSYDVDGVTVPIDPGPGRTPITQSYWRSFITNPSFLNKYPKAKMFTLFEHYKPLEDALDGRNGVNRDYRMTTDPLTLTAFKADMDTVANRYIWAGEFRPGMDPLLIIPGTNGSTFATAKVPPSLKDCWVHFSKYPEELTSCMNVLIIIGFRAIIIMFILKIQARLLNVDGSLIAFAGGTDKDAKVVSAIVSNIWVAYERHTGEGLAKRRTTQSVTPNARARPGYQNQGSPVTLKRGELAGSGSVVVGPTGVAKEEEGLKSVLVQCEFGKLSITDVSRMLLCIVAGEEVEFGILKAKTKTLKAYLEEPLDMITA